MEIITIALQVVTLVILVILTVAVVILTKSLIQLATLDQTEAAGVKSKAEEVVSERHAGYGFVPQTANKVSNEKN